MSWTKEGEGCEGEYIHIEPGGVLWLRDRAKRWNQHHMTLIWVMLFDCRSKIIFTTIMVLRNDGHYFN